MHDINILLKATYAFYRTKYEEEDELEKGEFRPSPARRNPTNTPNNVMMHSCAYLSTSDGSNDFDINIGVADDSNLFSVTTTDGSPHNSSTNGTTTFYNSNDAMMCEIDAIYAEATSEVSYTTTVVGSVWATYIGSDGLIDILHCTVDGTKYGKICIVDDTISTKFVVADDNHYSLANDTLKFDNVMTKDPTYNCFNCSFMNVCETPAHTNVVCLNVISAHISR